MIYEITTEQSKSVQILRGIAIIAVVFIHNTPNGLAQVFCKPFLNFSVCLFLFLSGLLSNLSNWNASKRIVKVLIPYILWTLIYTVLNNMSDPISIPVTFFKSVFTARAAAIMHYVFVYSELTILVPIIDKLAKSKYKYWGFLISPIEIIVMRTIPLIMGIEVNTFVSTIMNISCLGWFIYFYLGYLIGNKFIVVNVDCKKLSILWIISIILQIAEGFYYYSLGNVNCGTQLKITATITGLIFAMIAYSYITRGETRTLKMLKVLGDNSFGIYFSHLAVMAVINRVPVYDIYVSYPFTAVVSLGLTTVCVLLGKRVLGKYSKYLAL